MLMLRNAILRLEEVQELAQAVEKGRCPAAMTGLSPVHRAHVAAAVSGVGVRTRLRPAGRSSWLITADNSISGEAANARRTGMAIGPEPRKTVFIGLDT